MKRTIVTFIILLSAINIAAQNLEYQIKGDEAKKKLDYGLAKMYYEDGVRLCDPYSINQLYSMWMEVGPEMRISWRRVMASSLNCLEDRASQNDTVSMNLLIMFYDKGVGTEVNKIKADTWREKLNEIKNPRLHQNDIADVPREKVKMDFFVGYAATLEAPYGLTVGGVGKTVGWYLRLRSNFSSQKYSKTFTGKGDNVNITGGISNGLQNNLPNKKVNMIIGTGGIVFKLDPSFYLSIGAGYCKRESLREFSVLSDINVTDPPIETFWAKSIDDATYESVALDLDGTFKIGKHFYGTIGCSVLNFKYLSANAGIGLFF